MCIRDRYNPAPIHIPTPDVAHIPAAVVKPETLPFFTKITPAPKKPTPLTIWAAIREPSISFMSIKPYFDTNIIKADPKARIACVRTPAPLFRLLRS